MADKVMEVAASPIAGIQACTTPTSNMPPPSINATDLSKQVDDLRSEIARLEKLFTKLSRSRSSSSSRSRRPPTPEPSATDSLCWYHHTFIRVHYNRKLAICWNDEIKINFIIIMTVATSV